MEKARQIIFNRIVELIERKDSLLDYEVRYEGYISESEQKRNDERYHELNIIQHELEKLLVRMYEDDVIQ